MPEQTGLWNGFRTDVGQRLVPGGQTGRNPGPRTITDYAGSALGSMLFPGGGAVGGELGERLGNTRFGQALNRPGDFIRRLFGGGNASLEQLAALSAGGTQVRQGTQNTLNNQIWNLSPRGGGVAGTPANSYLTGNFPASQTSSEPVFTPIDLSYGQDSGEGFDYTTGRGYQSATSGQSGTASSSAPAPIYQGQQGAATSLGGMGRTVGTATMSQVENMLSGGRGRGEFILHPRHEIGEARAEARANGQTLAQYMNS